MAALGEEARVPRLDVEDQQRLRASRGGEIAPDDPAVILEQARVKLADGQLDDMMKLAERATLMAR